MARAPLPSSVPLDTFFVLRWDTDREEMVVYLNDAKRTSHTLGNYLPQVVRQFVLWGLPKLLAERIVDTAREFRAVQVIPKQDRIINLIPRQHPHDVVGAQLAQIDAQENLSYVHL